jgi:hypothetical protein
MASSRSLALFPARQGSPLQQLSQDNPIVMLSEALMRGEAIINAQSKHPYPSNPDVTLAFPAIPTEASDRERSGGTCF